MCFCEAARGGGPGRPRAGSRRRRAETRPRRRARGRLGARASRARRPRRGFARALARGRRGLRRRSCREGSAPGPVAATTRPAARRRARRAAARAGATRLRHRAGRRPPGRGPREAAAAARCGRGAAAAGRGAAGRVHAATDVGARRMTFASHGNLRLRRLRRWRAGGIYSTPGDTAPTENLSERASRQGRDGVALRVSTSEASPVSSATACRSTCIGSRSCGRTES